MKFSGGKRESEEKEPGGEKLMENYGIFGAKGSEIPKNQAGKNKEEPGSKKEPNFKEGQNFVRGSKDIDPPGRLDTNPLECKSCAEIKIGEIMTRNVVIAHEDALLEEIFALFEKHSYHTLPILNSEKKLVGIINQDIVLEILLFSQIPRAKHTHLAAVRSLGVHAKDIMITHPMTITPDSSLTYAADLMMKHRFDRVCITEDEKLVGIISKRDIIKEVSKRISLEKG
ncbi:MAG: HPP family protein [Methanosarcinaceae archaeon]|uniref:CBS domain-containing protein n=1 Tax=Methanosarcina sp. MTP4 TaxID=1434100 RepID=UPI000A874265|nr:CBS domain-containing protein [Methanosarcina sp. MTP4]